LTAADFTRPTPIQQSPPTAGFAVSTASETATAANKLQAFEI